MDRWAVQGYRCRDAEHRKEGQREAVRSMCRLLKIKQKSRGGTSQAKKSQHTWRLKRMQMDDNMDTQAY